MNQRGFRELKKGFVHEAKRKNSFAHSTKPEKDFDFWNKFQIFKKDFSIADNHFESDLGSCEIFLRVSIFGTKWFGTSLYGFGDEFLVFLKINYWYSSFDFLQEIKLRKLSIFSIKFENALAYLKSQNKIYSAWNETPFSIFFFSLDMLISLSEI